MAAATAAYSAANPIPRNHYPSSLLDPNLSKSIKFLRKPANPLTSIRCAASSHSLIELPPLSSPSYPSFIHEDAPSIAKQSKNQDRQIAGPQWNLFQRAAAAALNAIEGGFISNVLERSHPLPKTADPAVQIAGNFAPVGEQAPHHELPVSGRIPPFINGVYVRNGANPLFEPAAGHHFFDGDGMVQAVKIRGGEARSSPPHHEDLPERTMSGKEAGPGSCGCGSDLLLSLPEDVPDSPVAAPADELTFEKPSASTGLSAS